MNYHYRILNEETAYRGFFQVTRYTIDIDYYNGGTSGPIIRECLGKDGWSVAALCYDPVLREFIFIEQFRIGAMAAENRPWQIEIVAGFMDKAGESPEEAMQRELQEEIGRRADKLTLLHEYYGSPGGSGGRIKLYLAEIQAEKTLSYTGLHDEGEDIRVIRVPHDEAVRWYNTGKINNATMLLAIQAFLLKHRSS